MMRQLESLVGEEGFRAGLRQYLDRYAFASASWSDLIDILDATTGDDLAAWSEVWVNTPGRPLLQRQGEQASVGGRRRRRADTGRFRRPGAAAERPRRQRTGLAATVRDRDHGGSGGTPNDRAFFITLDTARRACGRRRANASYSIQTDAATGCFLLTRAICWPGTRLVRSRDRPNSSICTKTCLPALIRRPAIISLRCSASRSVKRTSCCSDLCSISSRRSTGTCFRPTHGLDAAAELETTLWRSMLEQTDEGSRKVRFDAFADIATTPEALRNLHDIWSGSVSIEGLPLSKTTSSRWRSRSPYACRQKPRRFSPPSSRVRRTRTIGAGSSS